MNPDSSAIGFELDPGADPALATRYGAWLADAVTGQTGSDVVVRLDEHGLSLAEGGRVQLRPDFTAGAVGWRLGRASIKREAVARACGLKHGRRPRVVDATAGLGRDGLLLACLGCSVSFIERSSVVAVLLDDALRRAQATPWLAEAVADVHLINDDAGAYLTDLSAAECPEVVYLDPMFEPARRRGASGKETQLLERLVGGAGGGDDLLAPARQAARERVVVKRHRLAHPLAGATPDFWIDGRSTRFDAYLANAARP